MCVFVCAQRSNVHRCGEQYATKVEAHTAYKQVGRCSRSSRCQHPARAISMVLRGRGDLEFPSSFSTSHLCWSNVHLITYLPESGSSSKDNVLPGGGGLNHSNTPNTLSPGMY